MPHARPWTAYSPWKHGTGEFLSRELATLIGIDDLGQSVSSKGFLDDFPGVTSLQRDRHLVRQHPAAGYIHHGGERDGDVRFKELAGGRRGKGDRRRDVDQAGDDIKAWVKRRQGLK